MLRVEEETTLVSCRKRRGLDKILGQRSSMLCIPRSSRVAAVRKVMRLMIDSVWSSVSGVLSAGQWSRRKLEMEMEIEDEYDEERRKKV